MTKIENTERIPDMPLALEYITLNMVAKGYRWTIRVISKELTLKDIERLKKMDAALRNNFDCQNI